MNDTIGVLLEKYKGADRDQLIPILQDVQQNIGYLSQDAVIRIGQLLHMPASKIFGVATFYNQFRFEPKGRYHIQVCRGTACHVKGSALILETVKRALKIESGQTARDGVFSLEEVACLGACGLAPVIAINGEFHGRITAEAIPEIISRYRKEAGDDNEKKR
jgi:NADH-quinone oxidoreductase E subunit